MRFPKWVVASSLASFCQIAFAAADCASVPKTMPLRPSVLAPVAPELLSPAEQYGTAGGVLAMAYDQSQSVDQVLLRMRIESCQQVAKAMPAPSVVDPDDPAAYKPKTQFDNTPWRFNMTQNGKSMTADEFTAWLEAKGVRVVRRHDGSHQAPANGGQAAPAAASGSGGAAAANGSSGSKKAP